MTEGDWLTFQSVEFPQANDLWKVYKVAECVAAGSTTADEIADVLEIVPREGAYYASAACALRVVTRFDNDSPVYYENTVFGDEWVGGDDSNRRDLMLSRTIDAPHVKYVANELGVALPLTFPLPALMFDQERVQTALRSLPDLGSRTQARRASTIVSWMRTLSKIQKEDHPESGKS